MISFPKDGTFLLFQGCAGTSFLKHCPFGPERTAWQKLWSGHRSDIPLRVCFPDFLPEGWIIFSPDTSGGSSEPVARYWIPVSGGDSASGVPGSLPLQAGSRFRCRQFTVCVPSAADNFWIPVTFASSLSSVVLFLRTVCTGLSWIFLRFPVAPRGNHSPASVHSGLSQAVETLHNRHQSVGKPRFPFILLLCLCRLVAFLPRIIPVVSLCRQSHGVCSACTTLVIQAGRRAKYKAVRILQFFLLSIPAHQMAFRRKFSLSSAHPVNRSWSLVGSCELRAGHFLFPKELVYVVRFCCHHFKEPCFCCLSTAQSSSGFRRLFSLHLAVPVCWKSVFLV